MESYVAGAAREFILRRSDALSQPLAVFSDKAGQRAG
jgi:hypothetical protein